MRFKWPVQLLRYTTENGPQETNTFWYYSRPHDLHSVDLKCGYDPIIQKERVKKAYDQDKFKIEFFQNAIITYEQWSHNRIKSDIVITHTLFQVIAGFPFEIHGSRSKRLKLVAQMYNGQLFITEQLKPSPGKIHDSEALYKYFTLQFQQSVTIETPNHPQQRYQPIDMDTIPSQYALMLGGVGDVTIWQNAWALNLEKVEGEEALNDDKYFESLGYFDQNPVTDASAGVAPSLPEGYRYTLLWVIQKQDRKDNKPPTKYKALLKHMMRMWLY